MADVRKGSHIITEAITVEALPCLHLHSHVPIPMFTSRRIFSFYGLPEIDIFYIWNVIVILFHNIHANFHMSFQKSNQFEILIVVSKGIVQVGSDVEPAKVEEELEDEKDGQVEINPIPPVIINPLFPDKVDGKVEVHRQVHNLN